MWYLLYSKRKNNKLYIGQSVDLDGRWSKHKSELNRCVHFNPYLQEDWNIDGQMAFEFKILELCSKEELDEKEQFYIEKYNSMNHNIGYNLQSGGHYNVVLCEESREQQKAALKESYENNPELKAARKEAALKQWSDPDIKAKILGKNNGMYGHKHTVEAKEKMRQARLNTISKKRDKRPVLCVELNKIYENATIAMKSLGFKYINILEVCYGNRKTAGGYHWQFTE